MKTSMVLCSLVVLVCIQYINAQATLSQLENLLESSQAAFAQEVQSDPQAALGTAVTALAQAMGIAKQLVAQGAITNERAAELLIEAFKDGLDMTLHVPVIEAWVQGVCMKQALPFPDFVSAMFPVLTSGMDNLLPGLCEDLGMTYGQ